MPIYNYHCDECDNEFEAHSKIVDRKHHECPICEAMAEQQLTACHIQFGTPNDPNAYTAMKEIEKIGKKQQEMKERRARNANGTKHSSNIIIK